MENKLAPILSKNEFVEVIKSIQEQDKINEEVSKALKKVIDGYFVYGSENRWLVSLLKTLAVMFADTELKTIEWWLYEDVEKIITDDGVDHLIDTPEALYDYLITEQVLPTINKSNNIVIGNKFIADLEYTLKERESGITAEQLLKKIAKQIEEICKSNHISTKVSEGYYDTSDLNLYIIVQTYNVCAEKKIMHYIRYIELEYNIIISVNYLEKATYENEVLQKNNYNIREMYEEGQ